MSGLDVTHQKSAQMSAHVTQTQCVKLWKSWSNIVVIDCKMIDIHNTRRTTRGHLYEVPSIRPRQQSHFLLFAIVTLFNWLSTILFYDRWMSSASSCLWDFLRHKIGKRMKTTQCLFHCSVQSTSFWRLSTVEAAALVSIIFSSAPIILPSAWTQGYFLSVTSLLLSALQWGKSNKSLLLCVYNNQ